MGPVKDGRLIFSCIEPEGTVLAQPLLQVREGLHQEEELQVGQGHGQPTQHRPHLHSRKSENILLYTVRKVLADFAVCDWWRYRNALGDVKFSLIEGNGRKFSPIDISNSILKSIF